MIHKDLEFKVYPDHLKATGGCMNCDYCYEDRHDIKCQIFNIFGQKRLALKRNFCPVTGELNPGWDDEGPKIHAVFPDETKLEIAWVADVKQKALYTFEALCIFEDKTSAWVPFDYIKNEEEI